MGRRHGKSRNNKKENTGKKKQQKSVITAIRTPADSPQEIHLNDSRVGKINFLTKIYKFIEKRNVILAIFIAILQLWIAISQSISAIIQRNIDALYQPLEFEVERGEPCGIYGNTGITAYSTNIHIKNGSFTQIYVISYNEIEEKFAIAGTHFEPKTLKNLVFTASANPVYKDPSIPASELYDYFFIYTLAANGTRYLNCYYYVLDIGNEKVDGPFQAAEIECINISDSEPLPSYSYEQMLYYYQMLMNKIDTIAYSSCGLVSYIQN